MIQLWKILSSYQCFDGLPWEKCTENLVERMLKININVFNCKNENATTRPMISQNFRTFQKMRISEKISKNIEISNFIEEQDNKFMGWRGTLRVLRAETWLTVYRTIANTETIAKLARLGPAKNGTTMTEFGRVDKVLLDESYEEPKKMLSNVYWRSIWMW